MRELLSEKQSEVKDFENSQPVHIAKQEKACSGENTKDVAKQPLHKQLNHSFQLKPGIEMGLN